MDETYYTPKSTCQFHPLAYVFAMVASEDAEDELYFLGCLLLYGQD